MAKMTIREYARHRGVSHTAVQKAIARGRIELVEGDDGQRFVDSDAADVAWEESTSKAMQRDDERAPPPEPDDPANPKSYAVSQARREFFKAGLVELEYEQRAGSLVAVDDVRRETFKRARQAREMLLGIPDRLAPEFVGITDLTAIRNRMAEEITRALMALADVG